MPAAPGRFSITKLLAERQGQHLRPRPPDADVPIWFGILAPAGAAREIVSKLNAKLVEIGGADDMKARMLKISVVVPQQTPEGMATQLKEDISRNANPIRATGIKLE